MTTLAGYWSFRAAEPLSACTSMLVAQRSSATGLPHIRSCRNIAIGRSLTPTLPEDAFDCGVQAGAGGAILLAADVRLDNRDDLARALALGDRIGTLCDAAVLLAAWNRWGEASLERVVGDFAFALWDAKDERLVLARDFLGTRPLHYITNERFFAFASMARGLHALPTVQRAPDLATLTDFLALIPESGTGSFFANVNRVEPGCLITVSSAGLRTRRWWRPDLSPLRSRSFDETVAALRDHLDTAVAARTRRINGGVGAHLSGGLDSTGVTATAARLLAPTGDSVTGFTAVPVAEFANAGTKGRFLDEGPLAAVVAAAHSNITHVLIRAGEDSPFADLDRKAEIYERPVRNLCNATWGDAINEDAQARGLSVLLSGQAGNLSFSHKGADSLATLLAHGRLIGLARQASAVRRHGMSYGAIASQTIGPFLPPAMWRMLNRARGVRAELTDYSAIALTPEVRSHIARRSAELKLDFSYRPPRDAARARLWALKGVDTGTFVKGTLARWGLDLRDPTADRRLVEFCLTVAPEQFMAGGMPRALARHALADRLPSAVTQERRKGFQSADWFVGFDRARAALTDEIERIAASPAAAAIVDVPRLRRLIEEWPSGGWDREPVHNTYRTALVRAVSAGHFARIAEAPTII